MVKLPGREPFSMKIEDLKRKVPRCPQYDSRGLERNNGLAECHHRPPMGPGQEAGKLRAVARNDVYDLHRHSFYPQPGEDRASWPNKIGQFARSLLEGPKQSLIVLFEHERTNHWRMGTINEKPAMQIIADCYLRNITQEDVFILKTYFVQYNFNGWFPSTLPVEGNAVVKSHVVSEGGSSTHKIPVGFTYEGHANWWIYPPTKREGQTLTGRCCFVDQFDNEHWTAVLKWKYQ
ncbi:MAG: hypothetical protein ABI980_00735 [Nitrospirota bacterium]